MHYVFCDVIGSLLSESQSLCKTQNASLYLPCIVSIFMKQNDRITAGRMNDCVAFFGTLEYLYLRIPLETKSTFQANIPYQK